MEGDLPNFEHLERWMIFQSTPSAWRETLFDARVTTGKKFQSTPSAWRDTSPGRIDRKHDDISIHSLRMEGDHDSLDVVISGKVISIHSLRMEGDY